MSQGVPVHCLQHLTHADLIRKNKSVRENEVRNIVLTGSRCMITYDISWCHASHTMCMYIYIYIQTYRQCINIWIQMQVDSMCIRTVSIHKYTSRVCVYVYSVFYIHMCLQFCPHTYGIQQVKNKLLSQVSTLTWWSKAFSFRPWQANLHSIPKIEWIVSSPKDQWLRISDLMII